MTNEPTQILVTKGARVRHPATAEVLPEDTPIAVQLDQFWNRRLRDGSITLAKAESAKKRSASAEKE